LLSACDEDVAVNMPVPSEDVLPTSSASVVTHTDSRFTVRYNADYSFNPITGTSPDNMELVPLMYEGLFAVDENWAAQPVLCEEYETADGLTYTFTLKSDIAMHDGSTLTAQDVLYTLEQAMADGGSPVG
jgi:peptide/nickel transport system substrate-binding protein